jgi:hypothetical protein
MNFLEISDEKIFNDKNLLKEFLSYYSKIAGEINLNASCLKCISTYKQKILNIMNTENKNYILNEKYNGLFFETDHITNANITDKIAKRIILKYVNETNPITEIFAKYPTEKEILEKETLEKITKRKNK